MWDIIYNFVTSTEAWTNDKGNIRFHEQFFEGEHGFSAGILGAVVIALVFAAIFYFGFCNSKTSNKYATHWLWAIFLAVSGLVTFAYSDQVLIGNSAVAEQMSNQNEKNKGDILYDYSFYKSIEDYMVDFAGKKPQDQVEAEERKNMIVNNLKKGEDVNMPFNVTNAVISLIAFFLISVGIKRFTINGKCIPFFKIF